MRGGQVGAQVEGTGPKSRGRAHLIEANGDDHQALQPVKLVDGVEHQPLSGGQAATVEGCSHVRRCLRGADKAEAPLGETAIACRDELRAERRSKRRVWAEDGESIV